jgi:iron complex outermembrane recepter protein
LIGYRGTLMNDNKCLSAARAAAICATTLVLAPVTAPAAPEQAATATASDASLLDEILVTAEKRSESVQKTPLAVTALQGDALLQREATNLTAISQDVPGLNVSEQVGQARLTLRGIGLDNISTGAESSVAFNQDGIFYSRSAAALASFYDVDRVEVLRGPQGTLYGRNATGGSINIITHQPTSTLEGGANLTLGNYQTVNADGYVSGPLSATVAGRLSFQVQHHDGYGKNIVTGTDIDNKESQAVRGQLLFTPGDRLKILAAVDYYRSHDRSNAYHYLGGVGETASGAPITPTAILLGGFAATNPRDIASPSNPDAHDEFYGARIDMSYRLSDALTARSITGYRRAQYDVDTTISPFSVALFPLKVQEKSNQYTQEFQLNVDSDHNKLVSGLFYLHESITGSEGGPLNLLAVGGPDLFVQGYFGGGMLTTNAAALYAQDTYSVTDLLRITLGGRYSWERKAVDDQADFDFSTPYSPSNGPLTPHHVASTDFHSFTPKVGVDFDLGSRTLLYASFSKGFKSGTYNLGSTGPAIRPENVDAYEAGLKTTTEDGKFRANTAAFYYNYKDLQVGKVQGQQVVLENAAAAKIYGLEEELSAKPLHNLTLNLNVSWLHARFTRYVTADQSRPGGDGVTIDPSSGQPAFNLKDNELAQSPNYTVNLAAEYAVELRAATLTLRGESNWSDRVYFTGFDRDNVSQAPYSAQNAFVTYEPADGPWHVTAYVKNIADKTVEASANVATTLVGSPLIGFLLPPRTFGVTIGYRFK